TLDATDATKRAVTSISVEGVCGMHDFIIETGRHSQDGPRSEGEFGRFQTPRTRTHRQSRALGGIRTSKIRTFRISANQDEITSATVLKSELTYPPSSGFEPLPRRAAL